MAITDINNEDRLVQQTFADHLRERLGWESVYTYNTETFGPQGALGRASECEVVLVRDHVIKAFDRQDLRQVLGTSSVSGSALAKTIWDRLTGRLSSGTLSNVHLDQTRDLSFDYAG